MKQNANHDNIPILILSPSFINLNIFIFANVVKIDNDQSEFPLC